MKKIIDFLFGRFPKIFTKKGEVCHDLGPQSWDQWKNRYKDSEEYNWRQHSGMRRATRVPSSKDKK